MSLNEIKRTSAELLEKKRANSKNVSETSPSQITDEILNLVQDLGSTPPRFVPVVEDAHGLYGWCSHGVREKVKADRGRLVFGWTIWEWPRFIITAEFHCVWQSDTTELYDITPKPKNESAILFSPDPAYDESFNFDNRPRNRRACIYRAADPVAQVAFILKSLRGPKLLYEQTRAAKANLPLERWLLRKVPTDPIAASIHEWISACDNHEEYFDTFGAYGVIVPDAILIQLLKRRVAAEAQFKRLI